MAKLPWYITEVKIKGGKMSYFKYNKLAYYIIRIKERLKI